MVYDQYRKTEYKTLLDPVTHKKVIEIVHYLYDNKGAMKLDAKGQYVDIQA